MRMCSRSRGNGERKRAILGAGMRKSIIVSAECGLCIYSGPLQIAEITNFCFQICGIRGKKKLQKCGIAYPSDPPYPGITLSTNIHL